MKVTVGFTFPIVIALGLILSGCSSPVNPGRHQVEHLTIYSEALHANMHVDVYLPPHYTAKVKYPVLYLLHGKDANQNSWMTTALRVNSVGIDEIANQLMTTDKVNPMIIVSPEIDNSYGINTSPVKHDVGGYSRGDYETYITTDLVRYIDTHYSALQTSNGRFIGGYSMGGFAALHAAFTHPSLYSKVAVMSAALWNDGLPSSLAWIYPTKDAQMARDPITIAKHEKVEIPVEIIEGTSDPFYDADIRLYRVLKSQGAKVTLYTYPGDHNYAFWRTHAPQLLLFFGRR